MTQKATIDMVYQSKLRSIDELISDIASDPIQLRQLLIDLFAKNTLKTAVGMLWKHYIRLKTADAVDSDEEIASKDAEDLLQLTLIFQNYDGSDLETLTMPEVLTLMLTGKTDGVLSKVTSVNLFPAGFWQLPLVKEAFVNVMAMNAKIIALAVSSISFDLPDDWEDEKHPEGLYISLDAQVELLVPSIAAELIGVEEIVVSEDGDELVEDGDGELGEDEKTEPEVIKPGKKSPKKEGDKAK